MRNGAGEMVVWVHTEAERFVPARGALRRRSTPTTVAVTSGLADGERVVTEGAGLLAQVR